MAALAATSFVPGTSTSYDLVLPVFTWTVWVRSSGPEHTMSQQLDQLLSAAGYHCFDGDALSHLSAVTVSFPFLTSTFIFSESVKSGSSNLNAITTRKRSFEWQQ
jgi:hypothetical protein